eukprot:Skav209923  [mRNA]  locus=scaffold1253:178354:182666:- [translate_table: standard]
MFLMLISQTHVVDVKDQSAAVEPYEIPDVEGAEAQEPDEEPSLLQRLPFVEVTDAIAERLGLPQSKEVEALGRELIREPQRVLASPLQPPGTSTFQNPWHPQSILRASSGRQSAKSSRERGDEEKMRRR